MADEKEEGLKPSAEASPQKAPEGRLKPAERIIRQFESQRAKYESEGQDSVEAEKRALVEAFENLDVLVSAATEETQQALESASKLAAEILKHVGVSSSQDQEEILAPLKSETLKLSDRLVEAGKLAAANLKHYRLKEEMKSTTFEGDENYPPGFSRADKGIFRTRLDVETIEPSLAQKFASTTFEDSNEYPPGFGPEPKPVEAVAPASAVESTVPVPETATVTAATSEIPTIQTIEGSRPKTISLTEKINSINIKGFEGFNSLYRSDDMETLQGVIRELRDSLDEAEPGSHLWEEKSALLELADLVQQEKAFEMTRAFFGQHDGLLRATLEKKQAALQREVSKLEARLDKIGPHSEAGDKEAAKISLKRSELVAVDLLLKGERLTQPQFEIKVPAVAVALEAPVASAAVAPVEAAPVAPVVEVVPTPAAPVAEAAPAAAPVEAVVDTTAAIPDTTIKNTSGWRSSKLSKTPKTKIPIGAKGPIVLDSDVGEPPVQESRGDSGQSKKPEAIVPDSISAPKIIEARGGIQKDEKLPTGSKQKPVDAGAPIGGEVVQPAASADAAVGQSTEDAKAEAKKGDDVTKLEVGDLLARIQRLSKSKADKETPRFQELTAERERRFGKLIAEYKEEIDSGGLTNEQLTSDLDKLKKTNFKGLKKEGKFVKEFTIRARIEAISQILKERTDAQAAAPEQIPAETQGQPEPTPEELKAKATAEYSGKDVFELADLLGQLQKKIDGRTATDEDKIRVGVIRELMTERARASKKPDTGVVDRQQTTTVDLPSNTGELSEAALGEAGQIARSFFERVLGLNKASAADKERARAYLEKLKQGDVRSPIKLSDDEGRVIEGESILKFFEGKVEPGTVEATRSTLNGRARDRFNEEVEQAQAFLDALERQAKSAAA